MVGKPDMLLLSDACNYKTKDTWLEVMGQRKHGESNEKSM
jgi:hypothetical protein